MAESPGQLVACKRLVCSKTLFRDMTLDSKSEVGSDISRWPYVTGSVDYLF